MTSFRMNANICRPTRDVNQ